ncbi:MAG: 4-hydroxyphenylacetate decarboxylase large subunit, partial [Negativicutes bacterium]|nr:4-hydroxyphenylacetate decarboxylase large subunit [Negativicutes bacterium]
MPGNASIRKKPTPRAEKLREQYFNTLSSVSMEFPYWYTREYQRVEYEVPVVRRAMALRAAFSRVTTAVWPGELLVGGKTHMYRGSFPMPWLSASYFTARADELTAAAGGDDNQSFGSGGGNVTRSFGEVVSIAGKFGARREEIAPLLRLAEYWQQRSVESLSNRYEREMPEYEEKEALMQSLVCMFDSGYTLPQGREVANYAYPLVYGFDRLHQMAEEAAAESAGLPDGDGLCGMDRLYFYRAAAIVTEGIQAWIENYGRSARQLAEITADPGQKTELNEVADSLFWIAHNPPRTFAEALQLIYLLHIGILNEDAISGLSPGRIGQVLWPWYEQDLAAGRLTEERALELLECYRVKLTCIDCFASTGVVGGVLSGNTFNNVCVGGLTRDGQSAVNRLEYLILRSGISCQTTQPTLTVLYDEKLPEDFLLLAVECNKTGTGYPAWVNNRNAIEFLLEQYRDEGMTVEEARAIAIGGCLETSPCAWFEFSLNGKEYTIPGGAGQPTSVGVHFIANPKVLELVLFDGYDHRSRRQILAPHGKPLESYEELWQTFCRYYEQIVDILTRANNIQHDIWRKQNMAVFNSLLKPDCLRTGYHIGQLGYRYNATYNIESCGQINMTNSLAALKKLVYDDKIYSLEQMRKAILENFGYLTALESKNYSMASQVRRENCPDWLAGIHTACLNAPKYGNNDQYADEIFYRYERWFCQMCRRYRSLYDKPMYACQISVSTHGAQGMVTLAGADGRLDGTTYADGSVSAYPGTDREGVYALFESATGWDQTRSQNSQLNLKIHPQAIAGLTGSRKLLALTRAYLRNGGFHVQYNIVDSGLLRRACLLYTSDA